MSDLFILSTDEKFQGGITPTSTTIDLGPVFNNDRYRLYNINVRLMLQNNENDR